eukprot:scaffold4186_cov103-Alexandrium_tamarense.AAC.16
MSLPTFAADGSPPSVAYLLGTYPSNANSASVGVVVQGVGNVGSGGGGGINQNEADISNMLTNHDFQYQLWQKQQRGDSTDSWGVAAGTPTQVAHLSVSDAFGELPEVEDRPLPSLQSPPLAGEMNVLECLQEGGVDTETEPLEEEDGDEFGDFDCVQVQQATFDGNAIEQLQPTDGVLFGYDDGAVQNEPIANTFAADKDEDDDFDEVVPHPKDDNQPMTDNGANFYTARHNADETFGSFGCHESTDENANEQPQLSVNTASTLSNEQPQLSVNTASTLSISDAFDSLIGKQQGDTAPVAFGYSEDNSEGPSFCEDSNFGNFETAVDGSISEEKKCSDEMDLTQEKAVDVDRLSAFDAMGDVQDAPLPPLESFSPMVLDGAEHLTEEEEGDDGFGEFESETPGINEESPDNTDESLPNDPIVGTSNTAPLSAFDAREDAQDAPLVAYEDESDDFGDFEVPPQLFPEGNAEFGDFDDAKVELDNGDGGVAVGGAECIGVYDTDYSINATTTDEAMPDDTKNTPSLSAFVALGDIQDVPLPPLDSFSPAIVEDIKHSVDEEESNDFGEFKDTIEAGIHTPLDIAQPITEITEVYTDTTNGGGESDDNPFDAFGGIQDAPLPPLESFSPAIFENTKHAVANIDDELDNCFGEYEGDIPADSDTIGVSPEAVSKQATEIYTETTNDAVDSEDNPFDILSDAPDAPLPPLESFSPAMVMRENTKQMTTENDIVTGDDAFGTLEGGNLAFSEGDTIIPSGDVPSGDFEGTEKSTTEPSINQDDFGTFESRTYETTAPASDANNFDAFNGFTSSHIVEPSVSFPSTAFGDEEFAAFESVPAVKDQSAQATNEKNHFVLFEVASGTEKENPSPMVSSVNDKVTDDGGFASFNATSFSVEEIPQTTYAVEDVEFASFEEPSAFEVSTFDDDEVGEDFGGFASFEEASAEVTATQDADDVEFSASNSAGSNDNLQQHEFNIDTDSPDNFGDFSDFGSSPSSDIPVEKAVSILRRRLSNIQCLPTLFPSKETVLEGFDRCSNNAADPTKYQQLERCVILCERLAAKNSSLNDQWKTLITNVKSDLERGIKILDFAANLTVEDRSIVVKTAKLLNHFSGLAEFVRIVRSIAATIGDVLCLDESIELQRASLLDWNNNAIVSGAVVIEELWSEIRSKAADLVILPQLESVAEIRARVLTHVGNDMCQLTLQPLSSEKSGESTSTSSPVQWNGMKYMACSANFWANNISPKSPY